MVKRAKEEEAMGMLEYYDYCKELETCPQCRQKMTMVQGASIIGSLTEKEIDVYRCESCRKEFERVPLGTTFGQSVKFIWRIRKLIHW